MTTLCPDNLTECEQAYAVGHVRFYSDTFELSDLLSSVDVRYVILKRNSQNEEVRRVLQYRGHKQCPKTDDVEVYEITCEEGKYLELLQQVLDFGQARKDRTGTGVLSCFGRSLQFSLRNGVLPLLTTKRVFYKGVLEELLWFLQGSTDATTLHERGVCIWDQNGSKENLQRLGFTDRKEGDLGPIYGYQWRNWGGDQLRELIEQIQHDPFSRRHILSAWNRDQLSEMVLPPCHMMCQFYVDETQQYLSCMMIQRSADLFLGVPFNIASYALLTHIVAKLTQLKANTLTIHFGDAHIYENHKEAVRTQLQRTVRHGFPTVTISPSLHDLDQLRSEDITLHNYKSDSTIRAEMSV